MSSSVSVVLGHLNSQQQESIVDDIEHQLQIDSQFERHEVLIKTFCEILASSPEFCPKYEDFAYNYCIKRLQTDDPEPIFNNIFQISAQFESLPNNLLGYVKEKMNVYLAANPMLFNKQLVESSSISIFSNETEELSNLQVLNLLKFAEWYIIHNEDIGSSFSDVKFDQLCFIFLTHEEQRISKQSLRILKWRMPSICQTLETRRFFWRVIYLLEQSTQSSEITYGYILWLRFFGFYKPDVLKENKEFQSVVSKEQYWYFLRDGLISLSHEHKKYALTLIQFSIQSLHTNLVTPIINWDIEHENQYIESWKRFCTLYEILGIDAAMNQAQAATNDLMKIFAPNSTIPVAFSLTILSVGFKASMDRVKNFALSLAFNLPKESLSLFKNDFTFISNVFLPFIMKSSHFRVEQTVAGNYYCEFGEKIREFICNCIDSLETPDDVSQLVSSIFDSLSKNRLTFGIARIYIAWGTLQGLQKKGKSLDDFVLKKLLPLFETDAEGLILKTALHTIHLRLLLHLNPEKNKIESIISAIDYFIKFNGYKLYVDNEEFFLDFFTTFFNYSDIFEMISRDDQKATVGEFSIATSLLLSNKMDVAHIAPRILSHPSCAEILVDMASSGLDFSAVWTNDLVISRIELIVREMIAGSRNLSISVYSSSAKLYQIESLFSEEFWATVNLKPLFHSVAYALNEVDNLSESLFFIAQFEFLTRCVPKCIYTYGFDVTFDDLAGLSETALKKISKGSDKNFYKAKDHLNSLILKNVIQLLKVTEFNELFRSKLLSFSEISVSISEYHSHKANVEMLSAFLDSCFGDHQLTDDEAQRIVAILKNIWNELMRDRLVLSQRDLHQAFIKLTLNAKLVVKTVENEALANSMFTILDELIQNSSGRKGLMPHLMRAISAYQVETSHFFEETLWIARLLVKAAFLFQSELNIFQLDCIVSQEFDDNLSITGKPLYNLVYGDPEISYRVTLFAIVGAIRTHKFAVEIWNYIFENENVFHFMAPKKRTDREAQWKRLNFLSLFVATCDVLETPELIHFVQKYLAPRLLKEASPLCRTYIEWLISLTIIRAPDFQKFVLDIFEDGIKSQQPLVVVTFERISMLVSLQLSLREQAEFLSKFVADIVVPLSTSNRSLNRHFSTSMACFVHKYTCEKKLELPPAVAEILTNIYEVSGSTDDDGTYRVGDAILWDIKADINLVCLTGGILLKTCDREVDALYEKDFNQYLNASQKAILRVPIGIDEKDKWIAGERKKEVRVDTYYVEAENENQESSLLQTKSGVWSTVMDLEEDSRAAAQVKRSPLIVVASLVDKAPNLGGICRLCDVLGAGWMTVHDINVKNDPEFKTVAVTADRWMPLLEVKMEDIIDFMKMKKKEGYTLIGLEQTDKSIELNNNLKFPEKSLILLGKEKEGIPGDLLAELDFCVIIKQVGIVRSMNIQTATAVIVHAYSTQHC
ncbi:hypothetical protein CANINC_000907 [Pichia inconspicua]|uniref:tRNA/rRNA methyltransferase SpoU type domain-containing protein n=1 Tax=Pichia inconspicua TaxID=52247 RepID=A0A4T0X6C1_9ASCO|nr:hypothetical protein CANINC_000907 [[Candida] inconspicua]